MPTYPTAGHEREREQEGFPSVPDEHFSHDAPDLPSIGSESEARNQPREREDQPVTAPDRPTGTGRVTGDERDADQSEERNGESLSPITLRLVLSSSFQMWHLGSPPLPWMSQGRLHMGQFPQSGPGGNLRYLCSPRSLFPTLYFELLYKLFHREPLRWKARSKISSRTLPYWRNFLQHIQVTLQNRGAVAK